MPTRLARMTLNFPPSYGHGVRVEQPHQCGSPTPPFGWASGCQSARMDRAHVGLSSSSSDQLRSSLRVPLLLVLREAKGKTEAISGVCKTHPFLALSTCGGQLQS